MKKKKIQKIYQPGAFVKKRAQIFFNCLMLSFVLIAVRAVWIQLFPSKGTALHQIAENQYRKTIALSPYRGTIFDHKGEPLAMSIRRPSFFINPKVFSPNSEQQKSLKSLLGVSDIQLKQSVAKSGYFAWLKRKVSPALGERINQLSITGLYSTLEPARFYPAGQSAANLIGYVGMDDRGLSGIEQQYQSTLEGKSGKLSLNKDARGQLIVQDEQNALPEQTGNHIYLTIDRAIQDIAESELAKGVATANAKGGFVIVSDPHTGRILAIANNPSYDPNNTLQINAESTRNQALTNVFEPGSTMKPLIAALAFDKKLVHEQQQFDCEGGKLQIGKHIIHDAHPPKFPLLSVTEIIVNSSNVCTYKIAKLLGMSKVEHGLRRFGIGAKEVSTGYPGETSGRLSNSSDWPEVRFANIAFGQGMTTTGLELVQAYGVFANGGNLIKPYLLDRVESSVGQIRFMDSTQQSKTRVIESTTARRIRAILHKTIEDSAVNARLEYYTAGGKTGTSQKVDPLTRAYSHKKHLASFVGIAPISDPHLVIYVQIDEPDKDQSYGALWAAPVFKEIAEKSLLYLNVAPDRVIEGKPPVARNDNPNAGSRNVQEF